MLLAPWRLWALQSDECAWQITLNKFESLGQNTADRDRFFHQDPVDTVQHVFKRLVDSPIELDKKYLGFPYYLKISLSCLGNNSKAMIRKGHLTGLKPVVLVTFHSPVNFYRWKIEQLQIQMEAAPFRNIEPCRAEEVCGMSWYAPMPTKNGSVVMHVDVSSNGLGLHIHKQRFYMNINGFLKMSEGKTLQFTVGNELFNMKPQYFVNAPSRPLWYTAEQSPVLILGGIPNEKSILLSDTSFKDFSFVELNIDSCWVGSFYCPQDTFTATIYDTISMESTLFIRQNQLIYYITGTYSKLQVYSKTGTWTRVLANECIKKLCPVEFHSNGSEYIIALTTGKNEGYVHFGTITDGQVFFEMLPKWRSVCADLKVQNCSIIWGIFQGEERKLLLLVEIVTNKTYLVVSYSLVKDNVCVLYTLPEYVPDGRGLEFLMIQGAESYTNTPSLPKGLHYNPYNNLLFIWGNFILQSYDHENYLYLADFTKESTIKYVTNSFQGDLAIVTETEEIWYLLEGSYRVYKLFPSEGWDTFVNLQRMWHSPLYTSNETLVTIFYENKKLYQLVYLLKGQQGQLVKRLVPVEQILVYLQLNNGYFLEQQGNHLTPTFHNLCPFSLMRLYEVPDPQMYTRQERYRALPPRVLEASGFHNQQSLAVYQGLVYYLLWLHSKYDKPYADPVHDPTWRWWKNKKQDQSYYFYLASNLQSAGGVYIEMDSYEKIYNFKSKNTLPKRIFLDKGTTYKFSIFLTAQTHSQKAQAGTSFLKNKLSVGVLLANPDCIGVTVRQIILTSHNFLFQVVLRDKSVCFDQGISGHHLKRTSMLVKVVGSPGNCFQNTHLGPSMQGNLMVPVLIGCPPGKRLAFDITFTVSYNQNQTNYFDCVKADPEMPCFHFRNIFYPFFLIQDLVTGESGSFQGSYVLKVVGGGRTRDTIKDYTEEEIRRYNDPQDKYFLWLCLENSPCYDTVPDSIFAPEFFFKVLVSNRGVDKSTYCDYQLIFLLHIHGLPFSAKRSLSYFLRSLTLFVEFVTLYLAISFLWPFTMKICNLLHLKINNMITSESYYSYISSSGVFSVPSNDSTKFPTKLNAEMADQGKEKPEET
ncbi:PREDICTED: cation channel sperm-associated protein subunit gamma [Chrysochloris asiatica]|uniref:Cation channel sperm-associated protein subunit gamma n=1 Tax=Chrysochloris asiatica TaxID=185453 RepID=A0A9B0WWS9_CHRAS|nr:PREDICTED: cation channel sperm-associated protein subunit gamma [Chrysochloris asiatica]